MMPEFHPDFVPDGLDDFTAGYFAAAEWTNPADELLTPADGEESTEVEEEMLEISGWSEAARESAIADCKAFQTEHAALLGSYYTESGRGEESAGIDFWLSRCGHGSGFFDRGNAPCFDALQDAARHCGSRDVYVSDAGAMEFA
jgi:hypothetical protein